MKKILLFLTVLFFVALPRFAWANDFVSPTIIDVSGGPRTIIEEKIHVKNSSGEKMEFYPLVKELGREKENFDSMDEKSTLIRWMEFTRSVVELQGGEERDLDLRIEIPPDAVPGIYHAIILFAGGKNTDEAEVLAATTQVATVYINMEVIEHRVEKANVKTLRSGHDMNIELPVDFNFGIENIGNQIINPSGRLDIYDRNGGIVDTIEIAAEVQNIAPGELREVKLTWSPAKAFGKYKAKLSLEYGALKVRDLQDITFFWVLPWPALAVFFAFVICLMIMIIIISKRSHRHHYVEPSEKRDVLDLRK